MEKPDTSLIDALKKCTVKASLEDIFRRYDIIDMQERINKLNWCMGNPRTFFSPAKVSLKETYELTIQMFLTMSWKLNGVYDKMDLTVAGV